MKRMIARALAGVLSQIAWLLIEEEIKRRREERHRKAKRRAK